MQQSESIAELAAALAAAQGEMKAVPKTADNPFFRSKYADLADVVREVAPVLSKHGLAVNQWPEYIDGMDYLTTQLMHASGQWMRASMRLFMAKADAQGQGSAITYGRRYSYGGATGAVTDADDDGNKASEGSRSQPPVPTAVVDSPPKVDDETGEVVEEDVRARNLRLLAEHRGGNVQTQHAQGVAQRLATRTRPSPRRPMP